MRKILFLTGLLLITLITFGQDTVIVKNNVFEVLYSQKLEQPIWLKYRSINRPTNVNRGSMDFYTEKTIKTSDAEDYKSNIYDKGHLAPAASFSDNMENLKQTFSYCLYTQYLYSALQKKNIFNLYQYIEYVKQILFPAGTNEH